MINLWEENVYKKNKQINKYAYTSIISNVYKFISDKNNKKVLDIGCGCGNNLKFLAENNFDCYGIDISKTALNICDTFLKKYNLNAKLSLCDSSKLNFENNYFDLIIDRASITHNNNFINCINEIYRVLNNNGIFITEVFGLNSCDKIYGEKKNENLYVNFTEGSFKDSEVFFIKLDDIFNIYKKFNILKLNEINYYDHLTKKNTQIFELVLQKN